MDAEEAQVESLLERISESMRTEDRAMEKLSTVLQDSPQTKRLVSMGVPSIMCAILRDDADDLVQVTALSQLRCSVS
jgi:hypothetical protein